MKTEAYDPLDAATMYSRDFTLNFQRAILLSLLKNQKLTQIQFEACMDKVVKRYAARSPS